MRTDHHKISPTAVMCARVRAAYTDMPYAQEIYSELNEEWAKSDRGMIPEWLIKICLHVPSVRAKASILEGRYYSTNKAIGKLGPNVAILELASGLSSRGLEMAGSVPYFIESDLGDMLQHKQEITGRIRNGKGGIAASHNFVPINPLHESELERAAQIMKDYPEAPLAIVQEGLFGYLTDDEQVALRDNIRNFLARHNPQGAWITPDFSYRRKKQDFIVRFIRKRIADKTERPANGFTSEEEAREFVQEGGLNLEYVPNEDIARNLSCLRILNISPDLAARHARNYRAAFITLA